MSQATIRLVDAGWDRELTAAILTDPSEIRIVCPFIKKGALDRLLQHRPGNVQVITRFNLADFAEGVSDTAALRMLLDAGASIRGIRNLHAKLYVFGTSRAIITSANLTEAALTRNQEFGVIADDAAIIAACRDYFDGLWRRASSDLSRDMLDSWEETVTRHCAVGGRPNRARGLGNFGADSGPAANMLFPFPLPWLMQTRLSSSFLEKAITGCRFLTPLSRRSKSRVVIGLFPIPRRDAPEASKMAPSCLSRGSRKSPIFESSVAPSPLSMIRTGTTRRPRTSHFAPGRKSGRGISACIRPSSLPGPWQTASR